MKTLFRISALALLCSTLSMNAGCNWGRFTQLKEDTPAVRLNPPKDYSASFANRLAVAVNGEQVELYVAGRPREEGGAVFELGAVEAPDDEPSNQSACPRADGVDRCGSLVQPSGLGRAWSPQGTFGVCFVSGFGSVNEEYGLWTRCENGTYYIYGVPDEVRSSILEEETLQDIVTATNPGEQQVLLAASGNQQRAWFYPPEEGEFVELLRPDDASGDFGRQVAVAQVDDGYLLSVSAPEAQQVWIYHSTEEGTRLAGCLSGEKGFGRELSSGDLDGDGQQDFLVADDKAVSSFSGAELAALDAPDTCTVAGDSRTARFECEETDSTGLCAGSDFGAALAVGDFDGDGRGEVAVGAPEMRIGDEGQAGAVFVFDASGNLENTLLASNLASRERLGGSLVTVPQQDRDVLGVSAPGGEFVDLYYCVLGMGSVASPRCQ